MLQYTLWNRPLSRGTKEDYNWLIKHANSQGLTSINKIDFEHISFGKGIIWIDFKYQYPNQLESIKNILSSEIPIGIMIDFKKDNIFHTVRRFLKRLIWKY